MPLKGVRDFSSSSTTITTHPISTGGEIVTQELWSAVDDYIDRQLSLNDDVLNEALRANADGGLPAIDITASQGKMLQMLARLVGARRILEVGTLGGYSTIWMARALPSDGRLITLEFEPKHAAVAASNIGRAGLASIVDVRVGAALDTLPVIAAEDAGPFDMFFIDADKANNPVYLEWALELSRKGSVIIVDNVVREGGLADAASTDEAIVASRKVVELFGSNPRLDGTVMQTVGTKGYDGFAVAMVV